MMLPPYFQYFQVTEICTPGARGAAAQCPELRRHLILSGLDIEVFAILMIKGSNTVYQIPIMCREPATFGRGGARVGSATMGRQNKRDSR